MALSRRLIGTGIVLAILGAAAYGIYNRINAGENESEGSSSEESGDRPANSATTRFSTTVPVPVEGREVVRDTLVVSVTAAAEAAAWRQTKVLALVEGRVSNIAVRENQRVSEGATLLQIDTTDLALEVRRAEANLASAEAQYRDIVMFDTDLDDEDLKAERDRLARARSGLDERRVALLQAQINLERARVKAPFAGRVASINVVQGQHVRATDELMTVSEIDRIKVEVQVLESEVGYLREGGSAAVSFAAFPDEIFTGRIHSINPIVDRQTRTAKVTVVVPNPGGRILPGMYARVSLEARRFPDRILVPKAAVLERNNRTLVFVYEPTSERDGLAKWHYVSTGLENDSLVEIVDDPDTDPLDPGRIVITDGHYSLMHDAPIRVVEDTRGVEGARPQ